MVNVEQEPFELRFPRRSGILYLVDLFLAFVIWHYFLWCYVAAGALVLAYWLEWASPVSLVVIVVAYWIQLIFWRPQFKNGWSIYKYILYSPVLSGVAHHADATFVREAALDPKDGYLFTYAPHGILGVIRAGSGGSAWTTLFPGIIARWGSFGGAFYIPGVREFSLGVGCVDAGMETLENLDQNINIIPGGIREMNLTNPNDKVTYHTVKNRTGFIKLAQKKNLKIVPIFCFGEKWMHCRRELPWPMNAIVRKLKMSAVVPSGRWRTLLPMDVSLGWVYGKPIETKERPICDIQQEYNDSILRIFSTYKDRFGYKDETLAIVEPSFNPKDKKDQ